MATRLQELLERTTKAGPVSTALSASEWHELHALLNDRDGILARIAEIFDADLPCAMPEPRLLPGIAKVEIPEDAAGLWDIDDAEAFAVAILKLRGHS